MDCVGWGFAKGCVVFRFICLLVAFGFPVVFRFAVGFLGSVNRAGSSVDFFCLVKVERLRFVCDVLDDVTGIVIDDVIAVEMVVSDREWRHVLRTNSVGGVDVGGASRVQVSPRARVPRPPPLPTPPRKADINHP